MDRLGLGQVRSQWGTGGFYVVSQILGLHPYDLADKTLILIPRTPLVVKIPTDASLVSHGGDGVHLLKFSMNQPESTLAGPSQMRTSKARL